MTHLSAQGFGPDTGQAFRAVAARQAQAAWASTPLRERLAVLGSLRHELAAATNSLVAAISRKPADTRAAEILPLLAACKFLESDAPRILAPKRLGRRGLPMWLAGVESELRRIPFGSVLIIGPANYPLFLPGVQVLQALAAGNAVVWKPGTEGGSVARLFASLATRAGLPEHLLRVTGESVDDARTAMAEGPDKIFLTGSVRSGRAVLRAAAETLTPVVTELSGCDAVLALPSADPELLADALCFGMRLNSSATCMAPRRLILIGSGHRPLLERLKSRFAAFPPESLPEHTRRQLDSLLQDAEAAGATALGEPGKPVLVLDGSPAMAIAQADIFAPVLTVLEVRDSAAALRVEAICPYGLTTSIFGNEADALALAAQLDSGAVLINDLIVPTADPRIPFTGRRNSGFGTTRGEEGLLEMTAPQAVLLRKKNNRRQYQDTDQKHANLFDGIIQSAHGRTWPQRWAGIRLMIAAARTLK